MDVIKILLLLLKIFNRVLIKIYYYYYYYYILHLKHVWAKYWSPQNFQFCNFFKLASDVFNTHGQNIIFAKPILWYLETSISM